MNDLISRKSVIEALMQTNALKGATETNRKLIAKFQKELGINDMAFPEKITQKELRETPDKRTETHSCDCGRKETHGDVIYRQYAIEALDKRFDDIPMELTTEILLLRNDLRERIPSAEPAQKWIPCSDRLPEEGGFYICTCSDGANLRTTFFRWQKRAKSWDKTGQRSYWKVIAWMPLPEPYSERRTDEE